MTTVRNVPNLDVLIDEASTQFVETIETIVSTPTGGVHGDGIARVVFTGGGAGAGMVYMAGKPDHKQSNEGMIDHIVELVERKAAEIQAANAAETLAAE